LNYFILILFIIWITTIIFFNLIHSVGTAHLNFCSGFTIHSIYAPVYQDGTDTKTPIIHQLQTFSSYGVDPSSHGPISCEWGWVISVFFFFFIIAQNGLLMAFLSLRTVLASCCLSPSTSANLRLISKYLSRISSSSLSFSKNEFVEVSKAVSFCFI
jgi:hypothetical protein